VRRPMVRLSRRIRRRLGVALLIVSAGCAVGGGLLTLVGALNPLTVVGTSLTSALVGCAFLFGIPPQPNPRDGIS
jgi:hypothetical protein